MSLYLDTSVIVPTIVVERTTEAVGAFLLDCGDDLTVSDFAAAALSRLVGVGQPTATKEAERLANFDAWRTGETETAKSAAHDCRLANTFVCRFDLSLHVPDALHAAICRRLGMRLVTLDRRMAAAAQALEIDVLVPVE